MKRSLVALSLLALVVSGCSDSNTSTTPTTTTPVVPKFTATLSPASEVPAVTNADATGSGTATITLNTTKDAAGNITAATADFTVTLSGFPANTTLTGAHIHPGAAGSNGSVAVSTGLANGEVVLTNGSGSFTKTGATVAADLATAILANPAGYYFNVHTTLNTGGAVRAQLVRLQ